MLHLEKNNNNMLKYQYSLCRRKFTYNDIILQKANIKKTVKRQ